MGAARLAAILRAALPALVFAALLGTIFLQQPRTMSYFGVNLLLSLALPVLLAAMAQMLLMAIGDLDLSKAVAHHGLHFAPDPSSQQSCSIGGNVANNSGGPHCLADGVTEADFVVRNQAAAINRALKAAAAGGGGGHGHEGHNH